MISDQLIIIPLFSEWNSPADFEKQTSLFLSKKNKVIVFHPSEPRTILMLLRNKKLLKNFSRDIESMANNLTYFPVLKILPLDRFPLIKKINKKIMILSIKMYIKFLNRKPILWIFQPSHENLVSKFNEKIVIYDCVDFQSSIDKQQNSLIIKKEKKLIKKSDIVFTNSPALYNLKKRLHSKCFKVPLGFDSFTFLTKKSSTSKVPKDLKKITKPRIGFIGNIDYRINFKLVYSLAVKNPKWSFIFIGPTNKSDYKQNKAANFKTNLEIIKNLPNTYFLGFKNKKDLISYYDHINIGIIPYDVKQKFCLYSYPMKIFEYFSRGVPVVATPVKNLIALQPLVEIANNEKSFSKKIKFVLKNEWPMKYKNKQKELASLNSWENKINIISNILKKQFPGKSWS